MNREPGSTRQRILDLLKLKGPQTSAELASQIGVTAVAVRQHVQALSRAGLLETSGALGANLLFWDDRIELRSDVFNFGAPRHALNDVPGDGIVLPAYWPRWRTMLKVQPIPHVYLMAGVDDVLNFQVNTMGLSPQDVGYGFDYFFGAGLTFEDDDLRSILPFVPSF